MVTFLAFKYLSLEKLIDPDIREGQWQSMNKNNNSVHFNDDANCKYVCIYDIVEKQCTMKIHKCLKAGY